MATGPHHYREAERLLKAVPEVVEKAANVDGGTYQDVAATAAGIVATAQVHATLALAAATAYPAIVAYSGDETGAESRGWVQVTS